MIDLILIQARKSGLGLFQFKGKDKNTEKPYASQEEKIERGEKISFGKPKTKFIFSAILNVK